MTLNRSEMTRPNNAINGQRHLSLNIKIKSLRTELFSVLSYSWWSGRKFWWRLTRRLNRLHVFVLILYIGSKYFWPSLFCFFPFFRSWFSMKTIKIWAWFLIYFVEREKFLSFVFRIWVSSVVVAEFLINFQQSKRSIQIFRICQAYFREPIG